MCQDASNCRGNKNMNVIHIVTGLGKVKACDNSGRPTICNNKLVFSLFRAVVLSWGNPSSPTAKGNLATQDIFLVVTNR